MLLIRRIHWNDDNKYDVVLVCLFKQISYERIQFIPMSIHIVAIWKKKCDLASDSDERAFNRMWQMIKCCYEKVAKFDIDEWPNTWPKVELLPLEKFYGDYPFYPSQHQYIIKWMTIWAAASAMHFLSLLGGHALRRNAQCFVVVIVISKQTKKNVWLTGRRPT